MILLQCSDQLSAEIGNVVDCPAPHLIAVAECGLIDPGSTGVDDVVLDTERSRCAAPFHDAGGDRDQSAVTDDADDLVRVVHLADEILDGVVSPKFVGCPSAGENNARQVSALQCIDADCRRDHESVLSRHGLEIESGADDVGALLFEAHDGDVVLEIFNAICNQDGDAFAGKVHLMPVQRWLGKSDNSSLPAISASGGFVSREKEAANWVETLKHNITRAMALAAGPYKLSSRKIGKTVVRMYGLTSVMNPDTIVSNASKIISTLSERSGTYPVRGR